MLLYKEIFAGIIIEDDCNVSCDACNGGVGLRDQPRTSRHLINYPRYNCALIRAILIISIRFLESSNCQ
jgi:hypothetical protein